MASRRSSKMARPRWGTILAMTACLLLLACTPPATPSPTPLPSETPAPSPTCHDVPDACADICQCVCHMSAAPLGGCQRLGGYFSCSYP